MAKLSIVGAKNSGKTTLIEQLIPKLAAIGLKVSTIKHTAHDHSFDTTGKDSHRHRVAGASQTLALSSAEMALFGEINPELREELEDLIERRSDICLIEGDKRSDLPKLLLTRNIDQITVDKISNVVATYGPELSISNLPHISHKLKKH